MASAGRIRRRTASSGPAVAIGCGRGVALAVAALAISTPTSSVSAFSQTSLIATSSSSRPGRCSSMPSSSTRLSVLQPGKGGIVVEAKTDFVARDILLDAMMGRIGGVADGEGAGQQAEEEDEFKPNEEAWVFEPSARTKQKQRQQVQDQQTQRRQAMPPQSPPPPPKSSTTAASSKVPSNLSDPSKPKSKLPDPSQMKLEHIQGELELRRIDFSDCFDRTSMENKLREGRAAMRAAKGMDSNSRRNANGASEVGNGGVIGADTAGRSPSPKPKVSSPPRRPAAASSRSSAAEQAIFSSGRTERIRPQRTARSASSAPTATRSSGSASSAGRASGNPFSRSNRQQQRNLRRGGNSSSSFRDNAQGIGFGDANTYSSPGAVNTGRKGAGGGAGVRLGKKKTSYGDFDSGSSVGGNFGSASGGSNVGGGNASFRSAGGSTQTFSSGGSSYGGSGGGSFNAGGVSIKGDSSIFSSTGFVGQGGSTTVFSSGGGGVGASGGASGVGSRAPQTPRPRAPVPPANDSELDWLTQDSPSQTNQPPAHPEPATSTYSSNSGYEDDNIINDSASQYASNVQINGPGGKRISQQYQEQGLDMLSGGKDGFGAIQGIEKSGGDLSHRGREEDVRVPGGGVVGDTGVTMGGDFGSSGGSNVAGGSRRSARYSGGGGGGFGGIDYGD